MMEKKQGAMRNSAIELLRLLSMLMIVFSHVIKHGGGYWCMVFSFNTVVSIILGAWGSLGTCLFIIISAWFSCDRNGIRSKKILYLILQSWTYAVLCAVLAYELGIPGFGNRDLFYELLTPLSQENYWFITAYIFFLLVLPILQFVAQKLTDSLFDKIIVVLTVLLLVNKFNHVIILGTLGDFVYLFFVSAWLKRKPNNFIERHALIGSVISFVSIVGVMVMLNFLGNRLGRPALFPLIQSVCGKWLPVYYMAFCVFYVFKNHVHIPASLFINGMAKTSLGIYILHENLALRGLHGEPSVLWSTLLHVDAWIYSPLFGLYVIGSAVCVFVACMGMEKLREFLIDRFLLDRITIWDSGFYKFDASYRFANEEAVV